MTNNQNYNAVLILELADEMASSAASFNSQQNYTGFIQSRDHLKKALSELFETADLNK